MSEYLTISPPIFQTWFNFVGQHDLVLAAEAELVADWFAPEMRRYCEFIQGPNETSVGLMVRGEGLGFTTRVQRLMRVWNMPEAGITHHAALAAMFEHKRAFLKLEWHPAEATDQSDHLLAFYFRRRPQVKTVLEYLQQHGVHLDILEGVANVARLLNKNSVHFVATALRPGHHVRHKLYFSQYVTPERFDEVTQRLQAVLAYFRIAPDVQRAWAHYHTSLLVPDQVTTIFVSVSFEQDVLVPSVKFDYPEVEPQVCLEMLPPAERGRAGAEIQALCQTVGLERLSYLGVRLNQFGPLRLKYYADFKAELLF